MGSIDHPKGKLKLLPAEHSDTQEILEMQLAAFRNPREPYIDILFPHDEPLEKAVKRTLDFWLADPSATYLKVIDEDTEKIISAAKWCIYREQLTKEQMDKKVKIDWHQDPEDNAYGEHCLNWVHERRMQRTKGKPCVILDMLSTHPDHQRRGAGTMLMKWGTEVADSLGYEAFIEASSYGKHLYESWGFIAVPNEWIVIPVSDKWKHRPEQKFYWLERPAKMLS